MLAAALLIAGPIEYLQQYVGGRFPDVTDIALSLGGAWFGAWTATQGWRLFDDQIALISSSQTRISVSPLQSTP